MNSRKTPKNSPSSDGFLHWLISKEGSVLPLASGLSLTIAILFRIKPLTPLLSTLALAPFFLSSMRKLDYKSSFQSVLRWALATFVFAALLSVFLPEQAGASFPLAQSGVDSFTSWASGTSANTPFGYKITAAGIILFVVASLFTGGIGGLILISTALCSGAFAFAYIARHADNILHIALIGIPPWEIAVFFAAFYLLVPISSLSLKRFSIADDGSSGDLNKFYQLGFLLLVLGVLLGLMLSGFWANLIKGCTIL